MKILQLPALSDNYVQIICCEKTKKCMVIDTPDAELILAAIEKAGLKLVSIYNTHHHWDHAGGNPEIRKKLSVNVYASEIEGAQIGGAYTKVKEGDKVNLGELEFTVIEVPGHTLGHTALYGHGAVFCGDSIFVGGCGRMFEGTPKEMQGSLAKLKMLPDETKVYCAHEYTENNLKFALTLEPHNKSLQAKLAQVKSMRRKNLATVPSSIGEEKSYNPFLRWDSVELLESLRVKGFEDLNSHDKVFAATRRLKDSF